MESLKTLEGDLLHIPYKSEFHDYQLIPACGDGVEIIQSSKTLPEYILVDEEVNCPECLKLGSFGSLFGVNTSAAIYKREPKYTPSCWLYLIKASNDSVYKIGSTGNVQKRFSQIQACSPIQLELVHSIYFTDAYAVEKALHETFREYRLHNEWFRLPKRCVKWICSWGGK